MTESTGADMQIPDKMSLKSIEDCRAREDLMTKIFCGTLQDTPDTVDLRIHMTELENLLSKEMRMWWDLSTLKRYVEKNMVPRGLRIRKFPTMTYTEEFKTQWEKILTDCSIKLMELIISQEESMLRDIRDKIVTVQSTVKVHSSMDLFNSMDSRMTENLNKLEKMITDVKQNKFQRDLQDYKSNMVYIWQRPRFNSTPRSILKKPYNRKAKGGTKVNFNSTDAESSDTPSEGNEGQRPNVIGDCSNMPSNPTKVIPQGAVPKNAARKKDGERAANIDTQPRYPRRTKNT